MFFKRKRALPEALKPPFEADERLVAWAPTSDGRAVVATNLGLWLPGPDRLGWHEIHKASWNPPRFSVIAAGLVVETDEYAVTADQPEQVYALDDPGDLPEQVRARVTRSVAHTSHHSLAAGGGVRVVARRVSGMDGLTWHVRYDDGTPVDDATVAPATADFVAAARRSPGIIS